MADDTQTHRNWIGRNLYDQHGQEVGTITDIFYDDVTGQPEWLSVATGWFGTAETFVPIAGTTAEGGDLRVEYDVEQIRSAPRVGNDEHLDPQEEERLYAHYGFNAGGTDYRTRFGIRPRADEGFSYDDLGPVSEGDVADTATSMVRSEEELQVEKIQRQRRAQLRKYTVVEDVQITVPIRKVIARLEVDGEPLDEVVLEEDEVRIETRAVARENVRLEVETIEGERQISGQLRKERIEVDDTTVDGGPTPT